MDEGTLQKNKWVRMQHGLPLAGKGKHSPCRSLGSLADVWPVQSPKETLLGGREAGHIGTSGKVSQVVAPVGN